MNFKFYVNNFPLFQKKIEESLKLNLVREKCKSKMPNDAIFLSSDGCEIDVEDESDYSVSEIMADGIIHMSSKTFQNENIKPKIIKKSTPINGSKD